MQKTMLATLRTAPKVLASISPPIAVVQASQRAAQLHRSCLRPPTPDQHRHRWQHPSTISDMPPVTWVWMKKVSNSYKTSSRAATSAHPLINTTAMDINITSTITHVSHNLGIRRYLIGFDLWICGVLKRQAARRHFPVISILKNFIN